VSVSMFNAQHYEEAVEFFKTAEDKVDWRVRLRAHAKPALGMLVGTTVGAGGGMLAGVLADKIYGHFNNGKKIPPAVLMAGHATVGALLGAASAAAARSHGQDLETVS